MRFLALLLLVLALALAACGGGNDAAGPSASTGCPGLSALSPDTVMVKFTTSTGSVKRLVTQLADTGTERAQGLKDRDCLPENEGMLFAYSSDSTDTYWMQDTRLPLTIAFIQADGAIVSIEDMQPESTASHGSPQPYRYAVEANQGWFAQNGVAVGDKADIHDAISEGAQ